MADYPSTMSEQASPPRTNGQGPAGEAIIRNPDGSITVVNAAGERQEGPRIPKEGDFDENLADLFTTTEKFGIAQQLIEYEETDRQSRKDWEEREQRALEMLGIKDVPIEEKTTPGVHDVVHPVLMTACVQFQARAFAEYCPPEGPVKGAVIGTRSRERLDQAARIETFMNYYLTEVDAGYYPDCDQMLMYLPMSGSAFKKCSPDWRTGLPNLRYVKATNFIAPYAGTVLENMPRYAHTYTMTGQDITRAIATGMFAEIDLPVTSSGSAKHSKTSDTADLREVVIHQDDKLYQMLEYHIEMPLENPELVEEDSITLPWLVLVEKESRQVALVRRNWKEEDEDQMKRIWFSHYKFLPGLGFYGFGFPHVIGSLGRAASGVVNALLDAALFSALPGGFKAKEGKGIPGGEIAIEAGVFKEIDLPYEDAAKAFFKPDVGKPEPALFQLLEHFVNQAQIFTSTTELQTGDAPNQAPVGTTVALLEQSSRVQTSIHKRMHISAKDEFRMLAEFIHDYMPNRYDYEQGGEEKHLLRQDFDGRVDVRPVSDPNIFSATQRIAMAQAVVEAQLAQPDLFSKGKRAAGMKRLFEAMRVPDLKEVAPDEEQGPQYLDPVAENAMMAVQEGVKAFVHQDHDAHIAIHQAFLAQMQPLLPLEAFALLEAVITAHNAEHGALRFRVQIMQAMGLELPPFEPGGENPEIPPDIERGISMLAARALAKLPPPEPAEGQDPALAAEEAVAQAKIKREDALASAKLERDTVTWVAEEERKRRSHASEESRKDDSAAAELERQQVRGDIEDAQTLRRGAIEADQKRMSGLFASSQKRQEGEQRVGLQRREGEQRLKQNETEGKQKVNLARASAREKERSMRAQGKLKVKQAEEAARAKAKAAKAKPKPKKGK